MNLNKSFLNYCKNKNYEINKNQLSIINDLNNFYNINFRKSFWSKIFSKNENKFGFYLQGNVGVGKTMILDFFFNELKERKIRLHFNEFMIKFHDFIFLNKDKDLGINNFVKDLKKKAQLLYFDEFQVTNIVDAMILGRLFKKIFDEKIKVIFSSNIILENLYKDGLQREQFIPFINILKKHSYEKQLSINADYRSKNIQLKRFLSPLNETTNFQFNKFFRELTKDKNHCLKVLKIKGRKLELNNYFDGISKFKFDELCNRNLGAEDYIKIAENCHFIFIENLPNFNETNSNQQLRFITLIDVVYEKKIPLMITSQSDLYSLKSSKNLSNIFKRTISRLYELTSINYD